MKKARIIATMGPGCDQADILESMILAGVNVCRLNFSFGTHEEHQNKIKMIRDIAKKTGRSVAIMQAIQGPKIRMGQLKNPVEVKEGETMILSGHSEHKEEAYLPTTYEDIASDTEPGKTILIADGKIIVKVEETRPLEKEVVCKVLCGGTILTGKGINLPYTNISLPALTPKDIEDVKFGAKVGVDYMSQSFVRFPDDVTKLRELLKDEGRPDIPIIAKIEKPEAVENIDEILDRADGVMIARGDLADEISFAEVPLVQKSIIRKANLKGKITIIATEMLGSMVESPLPTRAETSDVANGILDGTDAVMLSNETAMGKNPVKAVQVMAEIVKKTESSINQRVHHDQLDMPDVHELRAAMCDTASHLSYHLNERAMIVLTVSGLTARILSKYRPQSPIYAITFSEDVFLRMAFYHNVYPILVDHLGEWKEKEDLEKVYRHLKTYLKTADLADDDDTFIVLTGVSNEDYQWDINSIHVWQ